MRYITARSGNGAREATGGLRRNLGAREATGGPWECGLLRRAADVVAGPRTRERAVGGVKAVFGAVKYSRRCLGGREVT